MNHLRASASLYREDSVFNASTYRAFLELFAQHYRRQGAILIQDNASYHIRRYEGKHGIVDHSGKYVWQDSKEQIWESPFCN